MNRNIFKAHLEELLRQLSNIENLKRERKSRLLVNIQTQIEMCNLVNSKFNKDYTREKEFFSKVQEFILLDEFIKAINYISNELNKTITMSNAEIEDYV